MLARGSEQVTLSLESVIMLAPKALPIIDAYWASHFGIAADGLFAEPIQLITHAGELSGYEGVFALFRNGSVIVSSPPEKSDLRQRIVQATELTNESLASALSPVARRVIGPAEIRYATSVTKHSTHARPLTFSDATAVDALQQACDPTEWEHGGSSLDQPCSGVFVDGTLAALAGYEVWGERIAHLSIITHPQHRGRGLGREAVGHLAMRALDSGLLPQYRTLAANHPSIQIAAALGFELYATSLAFRL